MRHQLGGPAVSVDDVRDYPWPNTGDPERMAGLYEQARLYRAQGKAVMIKGVLAGLFEMTQRLRGMENCLMDMATMSRWPAPCSTNCLSLSLPSGRWRSPGWPKRWM